METGGTRSLDGRALVAYAVFGVLTTATNVGAYWVLTRCLGWAEVPSSVGAWVAAVAFAYVTNRRWVFGSDATGAAEVARECAAFFAARLATGALDWLTMWGLVTVAGLPDLPVKVGSNLLTIALNLVLSKLVVFRERREAREQGKG